VLDACAGVGGKTTHLAELAATASIDALDPAATKLGHLRATAARLGLSGIRTVVGALDAGAPVGPYDLVIVDAPCSGLGVVRRHPEAKARLTAAAVAGLAATQAALLDAAAARVAPGGALVYAVCTFTRAEGPDQLAGFLARHPGFALAAPPLPAAAAAAMLVDGALRTWPHRHDADGFFAARLRRIT
jgi:16S rRNA (cytosine967-C5)-methyltransferase